MDASRIVGLDAHAQADLVRRGDVEPTALVEAAQSRVQQRNPGLNAVFHLAFERALEAAEKSGRSAPMRGVPYLLKASMEYPGFPLVSGSRARRDKLGQRKFPFAAKLDQAGLIPCGTSAMPEFGLIGTGEGLLYGPTRNPWNPDRSSGGSSSGAAVAVATRMVPLATGSDGGGSIRIPASHCGVVGFKPSRNWNLRARGVSLIDDLLTSDAMLARSMRDARWAARYLRTQPANSVDPSRSLRIALCLTGLDEKAPEPDISEVVIRSARLCEQLGYDVTEEQLPLDMSALRRAFDVLWCYGAGDVVDLCRAERGTGADSLLEPWTLGLAKRRETISAADAAAAFDAICTIQPALDGLWQDFDLVLSPVTSSTAPPLGTLAPDRAFDDLWEDHFRHVNYTQLQNMGGLPALSLPLFEGADDMPAGSMFWTRHGGDDLLLKVGEILERVRPWAHKMPPDPPSSGNGNKA